jgi:hypothetical protein
MQFEETELVIGVVENSRERGGTVYMSQVPAMPVTPTESRIFAISLAVRTPLLAAR